MIPGLLVLSIAGGIVWADTGHRLSFSLVVPLLLATGMLLWGLASQIRSDTGVSTRHSLRGRFLALSGLICAAGLAFLVGFDRLDLELSRARWDARRTHEMRPGAVRVAEARVASRRSGLWGDEIELVSVRAADGGELLPRSLILRLADRADGRAETSPSRADRLLWPGAWVRVGLRISPFRASRNPGTPDREHILARRGYASRARLVKPDWVLSLSSSSFDRQHLMDRVTLARAAWRRRIGVRLEKEGRAGALVAALGLGDRSGIRRETREAFRRLGLSHLLAVSGLHVGLVAGLAGWLFLRSCAWIGWPGRNRLIFDWALCVACGAAAFYAWITGAGISVERAAALFALFAFCRLCLRNIVPAVALAWVAVGILLKDPAALFDVGAQLSFGACAALIIGGFWKSGIAPGPAPKRRSGPGPRLRHAASETFRASLVISLGTAPLLIQHGMPLSLLSPVVNVVAIPWLGLSVLPASLLAVLLEGFLPDRIFSVLMLPARGFEACIVRAAMLLPDLAEPPRLMLPIWVFLVSLGLFWIRRGDWERAVFVWVGISLAGVFPGLHGRFSPERPQVVFFEVGQGDASLVQGREAVLLIDTGSGPPDGSGGTRLVRGLRAMGVHGIDVLAVTHADLDHRAGAARVLASFSVEELWLPVSGSRDAPLLKLSKLAFGRGTKVRWLAAGAQGTDRGDLDIEVLWPLSPPSVRVLSRNEGSLVLRVVVDEMTLLFTADIGVEAEKRLTASQARLTANILKVAHHGSEGSSSSAFLEAVSATVAVVSAPCDPTRGLPSRTAIERLRRSGMSLWWTGRDGAVIAKRDAAGRASMKSWGQPRDCGYH